MVVRSSGPTKPALTDSKKAIVIDFVRNCDANTHWSCPKCPIILPGTSPKPAFESIDIADPALLFAVTGF